MVLLVKSLNDKQQDAIVAMMQWFAIHTKRSVSNWVFDIANGYTKPQVPGDLLEALMSIDLNMTDDSILYSYLVQISHLIHIDSSLLQFLEEMFTYYEDTRSIDGAKEMRDASNTIQSIYTNWDKLRVEYGLTEKSDPSCN